MKVGDLVRCRPRNERENYDAWLGLIVGEPAIGVTVAVQWVCSDGRDAVETVNHAPEELWVVNEGR
jgi:hypothetical protein